MKLKIVYHHFAENLKRRLKSTKVKEKIFFSYRQYWCQVKKLIHIPLTDTLALIYDSREFDFHTERQPF
jgi:hypothetical protein